MPSILGMIAIYYAKKLNKPYLIEMVGCPLGSLWNHSWKGKLVAPIMWFLTKYFVKKAEYVTYVTSEFLQKRYPTVGKTLSCSDVALQSLDDSILENRLRKIENMDLNKTIILATIGAVNVRYKGQETVIKAISKLKSLGYKFEYYLVGGGDNSYLRSISRKYNVTDEVKFLGFLTHDKVFKFLDDVDIYIQPSKTEGLPRALIEAMSRACPAIGNNVGGIPELINPKFLIKNGKVSSLCELLEKMIGKRELLINEAIRSFNKAKEFDINYLNNKRNLFYKEFFDNSVLKNEKNTF